MRQRPLQQVAVVEPLEERTLLSASTFAPVQLAFGGTAFYTTLVSSSDYTNNNPPGGGLFRDVAGATNINWGPDALTGTRQALNFIASGASGPDGMSLFDLAPGDGLPTLLSGSLSLGVDILAGGPDANSPGLVALFNDGANGRGLALVLTEAGATDTLGLYTIGQDGALYSGNRIGYASLNGQIENGVWYYLRMNVSISGGYFNVISRVYEHANPDSPVGAQIGGTLYTSSRLASRGLQETGQVGVLFDSAGTTGVAALRNMVVAATEGVVPPPPPPADPVIAPGSLATGQIVSTASGLQFLVLGTNGNDAITVSQTASYVTLTLATGSTNFAGVFTSVLVYSFSGDDVVRLTSTVSASSVIYGGDGNDQLFEAGPGSAVVHGEAGNDLLVTVGGGADQLYGEGDFDSFWLDGADTVKDASATETTMKTVHKITAFYQPTTDPAKAVSLEIVGQNIPDPVAAAPYLNFASSPLFTNGPDYADAIQGGVSDCYLMASLGALAYSDPEIIRQMIAPLGDGSYAVRFYRNGQEVYVRVDADLPALNAWYLSYAKASPTGEIWVALTEKAYAQFRYNQNSYDSLGWGSMDTVLREVTNVSASWAPTSGTPAAVAQYIVNQNAAGHPVTAGTSTHAYVVLSAQLVSGQWTVTTYNPWGYAQTFTMAEFQSQFTTFITGVA